MPLVDVPTLGNLLLCGILVSVAYTMGVSIAAGRGRPHLLPAARNGVFATIALVATGVFLLSYAFQAHDFRIRYVASTSDRSMPWWYLFTALWGGQDGSLLWWAMLLCLYTLGFTIWVKGRYQELQPWVYATLMSILGFFIVTMLFAANPFSTTFAATPADGQGMNPLLQTYWMAIHPPMLYLGLTGWSVPFAICFAALITGRLGDEWILAARRWTILAFACLTIGNLLGMFWSYEELGWGGYWAWDPVENASFMPWLTGTAFVHSVMIQERRGMLKVWNVALMCTTFFMTIFGTFLTRSGLIASVHSFARSDIGEYFKWYLIGLGVVLLTTVAWRIPDLRGRTISLAELFPGALLAAVGAVVYPFATEVGIALLGLGAAVTVIVGYAKLVELVRVRVKPFAARPAGAIESLISREFAFLLNNWILLGMLAFVFVATTFPLLSELVRGETVTVGPGFYNRWMVPLGLVLLLLMGVGPLVAWRRATGKNLLEAFRIPVGAGLLMGVLHVAFGRALGFPWWVESEEIYETTTGRVLAVIFGGAPVVCSSLCVMVTATVLQELFRGTRVRMKNAKEGPFTAMVGVIARARRRYGGYIVHLGITMGYWGFMGAAYDVEREDTLRPGETMELAGYELVYDGSRDETDPSKHMLFADVTVRSGGSALEQMSPGKFLYRSHPDMPTTEVAIRSNPFADVYVILSSVDDDTGRGTFRALFRPFVWWIWFGGAVLLLGCFVSAFPSLREVLGESEERSRARSRGTAVAVAATLSMIVLAILLSASSAFAQGGSSTLHAGTVELHDPVERQLFERLLCQCGDCQRLPLTNCICGWAENMRAEVRGQLATGMSVVAIQQDYRERFGAQAIAIPSDQGLDRALWAVPVAGILVMLGGVFVLARRWRARSEPLPVPAEGAAKGGDYDDRLDDELRKLDEP